MIEIFRPITSAKISSSGEAVPVRRKPVTHKELNTWNNVAEHPTPYVGMLGGKEYRILVLNDRGADVRPFIKDDARVHSLSVTFGDPRMYIISEAMTEDGDYHAVDLYREVPSKHGLISMCTVVNIGENSYDLYKLPVGKQEEFYGTSYRYKDGDGPSPFKNIMVVHKEVHPIRFRVKERYYEASYAPSRYNVSEYGITLPIVVKIGDANAVVIQRNEGKTVVVVNNGDYVDCRSVWGVGSTHFYDKITPETIEPSWDWLLGGPMVRR